MIEELWGQGLAIEGRAEEVNIVGGFLTAHKGNSQVAGIDEERSDAHDLIAVLKGNQVRPTAIVEVAPPEGDPFPAQEDGSIRTLVKQLLPGRAELVER